MKKTGIAALLLYFGMVSCTQTKTNDEPLNVGYQNSPVSTLLMVAKSKGYFDSTGVKVNMQGFTAGKFAVTALISGKGLDLALSGELPIALATIQGNKLKVVTQVVESTTNECRIIALNDGKNVTPEQYFSKKRKIATSLKGTPEYFLNVFAVAHHIDKANLDIIGMKPEDMTSALLTKSVDAICIFDPVASIATGKLGANATVFKDPNIYSALYIISALDKTVAAKKDDIVKLLKSLEKAANYCKLQPDSAKAIVASYTKLQKPVLDSLWKSYNFNIALTGKLNEYLSDETKWLNSQNKTSAAPDYKKDVIEPSLLKEVNPSAVKL